MPGPEKGILGISRLRQLEHPTPVAGRQFPISLPQQDFGDPIANGTLGSVVQFVFPWQTVFQSLGNRLAVLISNQLGAVPPFAL